MEAQDTSVIAQVLNLSPSFFVPSHSFCLQLGWPDMRLPLLYSIAWPARVNMPTWKSLGAILFTIFSLCSLSFRILSSDFAAIGTLTFKQPDHDKVSQLHLQVSLLNRSNLFFTQYPCIPLAYAAGRIGRLSDHHRLLLPCNVGLI